MKIKKLKRQQTRNRLTGKLLFIDYTWWLVFFLFHIRLSRSVRPWWVWYVFWDTCRVRTKHIFEGNPPTQIEFWCKSMESGENCYATVPGCSLSADRMSNIEPPAYTGPVVMRRHHSRSASTVSCRCVTCQHRYSSLRNTSGYSSEHSGIKNHDGEPHHTISRVFSNTQCIHGHNAGFQYDTNNDHGYHRNSHSHPKPIQRLPNVHSCFQHQHNDHQHAQHQHNHHQQAYHQHTQHQHNHHQQAYHQHTQHQHNHHVHNQHSHHRGGFCEPHNNDLRRNHCHHEQQFCTVCSPKEKTSFHETGIQTDLNDHCENIGIQTDKPCSGCHGKKVANVDCDHKHSDECETCLKYYRELNLYNSLPDKSFKLTRLIRPPNQVTGKVHITKGPKNKRVYAIEKNSGPFVSYEKAHSNLDYYE